MIAGNRARPPETTRPAATATQAIVTAGHVRDELHLGYEGCWIATTTPYLSERNPAERMKSTEGGVGVSDLASVIGKCPWIRTCVLSKMIVRMIVRRNSRK